jgi:glutamate dehydrogenase
MKYSTRLCIFILFHRKSVKAFTDTILDLIVDTPETRKQCVNFRGRKEVIYLGPDEQVIPQDINWIIQRAAKRGYDTPNAFMSSKPRAGINHKEYGVTSEGMCMFSKNIVSPYFALRLA